jgi:cholestenol delta-isomerase
MQRVAGSLHLFFEGYFVLNHEVMVGGQDLFAMLWKEYAKSDSRYLSGDTLVLCMEGLTTVCPSISFLVPYPVPRSSC